MKFSGISRTFSTINSMQYETIGAFWDECSKKSGRENLRGLGYNWTEDSIEYVIGLKNGIINGANKTISIPNDNWQTRNGYTDELGKLYEEIYSDGVLDYEIESFNDDGTCEVKFHRA